MRKIFKFAIVLFTMVAYAYLAQAQTIDATKSDGEMLIGTPWGYFDDLAEDAAKYGIALTTPAGFTKWESGYSRGANYTCILKAEDGQARLDYHPIRTIQRLMVTDLDGEKVAIPHGTGAELPQELQSTESVEVYYAMLEKRLTEKQYFSRKECREFKTEKGFIANKSFDSAVWKSFKYMTIIVLKKGDVVLEVSLLTTPEGKNKEKRYLNAVYKSILFK